MRSNNSAFFLRAAGSAAILGLLSFAVACGGSSNNTLSSGGGGGGNNNQVIAGPGPNVTTLTVDAGPASFVALGNAYLNGAFVTVNVCVPGTTTCQSIDHVLVDTGSFGLRLLDSSSGGAFNQATVPLVHETDGGGNPIGECVQFVDNSFFWGSVATADVKISSETASSVPVHIVGDTNFTSAHAVPALCSTNNTGRNADSLAELGANGILGVGSLQQDCPGCAPGANPNPPAPVYYSCPGTGCSSIFLANASQVQNPVGLFTTDNNGVIVEIQSVPATGAPTATGALVFGIGTQSNNALGSASVQTLDSSLNITTTYKNTQYPGSFVDSGSNGLFFLDTPTTGLATCPSPSNAFYCPSSTTNFSATNAGQNGASSTVSFSIANILNMSSANNAFNNVGGPNPGTFDWGLPFFLGRNVFVSIAGKTVTGQTTPFVAY